MRYIGVVDCNNFFVSCERLFRPDLRTKPVLVLSSNDGCVVARSQEVKDMGIEMGVPYFQIKDIIKDKGITCFSSHFALYRDLSSRVFAVLRQHVSLLEIYSIDEAFFVLEVATDEEAATFALTLKREIERCVGIPVSVGMSDTKTRAKMVSKIAKKQGGVAVCAREQFVDVCAGKLLGEVWGVGRRLSVRYREAGIVTVGDLLRQDRARVETLTHLPGVRLQAELAGQSVYLVESVIRIPRSIASTRSFSKKTTDLAVIKDAVAYHVRHVMEDLLGQGLAVGTLSVQVLTARYGDYALRGGVTGETFTVPTTSLATVLACAMKLTEDIFESGVPYAKAGVVLSALLPQSKVPLSLFTDESGTVSALDSVVQTMHDRFGKTVTLGAYTKTRTWDSKKDSLSPAYTTRWSDLKHVATDRY